jgi:glycosyltransferase involved in cell wall biosynthesis
MDRFNPGGMDLVGLAEEQSVLDRILIPKKIDILAGVPEKRIAEIIQASDCMFQASKAEGFGMPILEAAACGVPSIVTDGSSMRELVNPPSSGYAASVTSWDVPQLFGASWYDVPGGYDMASGIGDSLTKAPSWGQLAHERFKDWTWANAAAVFDSAIEELLRS